MNNEYHNCNDDPYVSLPSASAALAISGFARTSGLATTSRLITDPYHSDYNIFGVDKTKIIEKLEEELAISQRSVSSTHRSCERKDEENSLLQKKNVTLEKKNKKVTKERDILKIDLKISENVKRHLLNRLDNS